MAATVKKGGVKQLSTGSKGGVKRPGGVKRGGSKSSGVKKAKAKYSKPKATDSQYYTKKNNQATKPKGGGSKYKNKFSDDYPGLRNLRDNIIF